MSDESRRREEEEEEREALSWRYRIYRPSKYSRRPGVKHKTLSPGMWRRWAVLGDREPPNIFKDMLINANLTKYDYPELIVKTTRVSFQLSAVFVFLAFYNLLSNPKSNVDPWELLIFSWCFTLVGHLIFQIYTYWPLFQPGRGVMDFFHIFTPLESVKVMIFFMVAIYVVAPVLSTLTTTVSSDSVQAVSLGLLFAHLVTGDYGCAGFMASRTISVNAAVFSSICLSSRLPTEYHVMAEITLCVQCFILFPMFSTIMWDKPWALAIVVTMVASFCFYVSVNIFLAFILAIATLTFLIPLWYFHSQEYKHNLTGPWDEAVVDKEAMYREKKEAEVDQDDDEDEDQDDEDEEEGSA